MENISYDCITKHNIVSCKKIGYIAWILVRMI